MGKRKQLFTLTRENVETAAVLVSNGLTERECRARVAFCGTDNLGLTRKEAAASAEWLTFDGKPCRVGRYVFTAHAAGLEADDVERDVRDRQVANRDRIAAADEADLLRALSEANYINPDVLAEALDKAGVS